MPCNRAEKCLLPTLGKTLLPTYTTCTSYNLFSPIFTFVRCLIFLSFYLTVWTLFLYLCKDNVFSEQQHFNMKKAAQGSLNSTAKSVLIFQKNSCWFLFTANSFKNYNCLALNQNTITLKQPLGVGRGMLAVNKHI